MEHHCVDKVLLLLFAQLVTRHVSVVLALAVISVLSVSRAIIATILITVSVSAFLLYVF